MKDEEVIIKLRKKYSKDDTVAFLSKRLNQLNFDKGVLQSIVDELIFENEKMKQLEGQVKALIKENKNLREGVKESRIYLYLKEQNQELRNQLKKWQQQQK